MAAFGPVGLTTGVSTIPSRACNPGVLGRVALPAGTDDQVSPSFVARRPLAEVAKHVCVGVREHQRVVPAARVGDRDERGTLLKIEKRVEYTLST